MLFIQLLSGLNDRLESDHENRKWVGFRDISSMADINVVSFICDNVDRTTVRESQRETVETSKDPHRLQLQIRRLRNNALFQEKAG